LVVEAAVVVEAEADAGVVVVDSWEFGVEEELDRPPLRYSKRWPLGRRWELEEHSLDLMEQARM
jgi:hypothetical protein